VTGKRLAPVLGALLLGCGGGGSAGPGTVPAVAPGPASAPLAICGRLRAVKTGAVQTGQAPELSGMVLSRSQPGVLWTHNDSGDRPRVFALRPAGGVLADLDVPGAHAFDWEDIAIRGRTLYLADIGDNAHARATIDIYEVPEPRVPATGTTAPAARLSLRYPDGPHDAETLLVDPRSGEIVIVTKELSGRSGVYVARGSRKTLRFAGHLDLGLASLATAGDVSADGRVIAIRTYSDVFAWRHTPGTSLAAALRGKPCVSPTLLREAQGEALALTRDGRAFYTVPEGEHATIRRYAPVRHSR
jgi:hypothetical protein